MTLLRLERVAKSFLRGGMPIPVLEDASMELSAGELFAVYGKRAAGKTTLLEIAAGLVEPDAGNVLVGGRRLAELTRAEIGRLHREQIGWVERDGPQSADTPVRVEIALPLYRTMTRRRADQRAVALLDRIGIGDYADALWTDLPNSVRTFVAIAQALVREPQLLVIDDPIYGLAATERDALTGLLRDLADNAGLGVLLAVPELPATLHAHRVSILAAGKLIGPSSPEDTGGSVIDFPRPRSA